MESSDKDLGRVGCSVREARRRWIFRVSDLARGSLARASSDRLDTEAAIRLLEEEEEEVAAVFREDAAVKSSRLESNAWVWVGIVDSAAQYSSNCTFHYVATSD